MLPLHRRCSVLLLVSLALSPHTALAQDRLWEAWMESGGRAGTSGVGGYGRWLIPLNQDACSLTFLNLSGVNTDTNLRRVSAGLAHRQRMADDMIWGVWSFLDYQTTPYDNTFHQALFGLELLGCESGFRVNANLPQNRAVATPQASLAMIESGAVVVRPGVESDCQCYDCEVERRMWCRESECDFGSVAPGMSAEFWTVAGITFCEPGDHRFERFQQRRVGAEMRLFDLPVLGADSRVVFSAAWQHDGNRGNQAVGGITVRIPLGPGGMTRRRLRCLDRRMAAPIVRPAEICTVAGGVGTAEPAGFTFSNRMIAGVTTIDGSTANPEADFGAAGADSLVIFNGDFLTSTGFVFSDGQVAIGGGGQISVYGIHTGTPAVFRAPGSRPTLTGTDVLENVMTLASDNALSGLNIAGAWTGVLVPGSGTFEFVDNSFSSSAQYGFEITGSISGRFVGNRFTGNGSSGLYIDAAGSLTGDFIGNHFDDNVLDGLNIAGSLTGDLIGNTFQRNSEADGLDIDGTLTGDLIRNVFSDNGDAGIELDGTLTGDLIANTANGNRFFGLSVTGTLDGGILSNTFDHNGRNGMRTSAGAVIRGAIEDNSLSGNVDAGADIFEATLAGDVIGNVFNNNGAHGLLLNGNLATRLIDNMASGNALNGFQFGDNNSSFVRNTADNNGGAGFQGGANHGNTAANSGTGNGAGGNTYP